MKQNKMKRFSLLALFIAIEIVLGLVPFLGFINLGFINSTTMHIPVIIAGIMLGKKEGMIVGFVFGCMSLLKATLEPNLSSFIFSPFISIGETSGNFASLIIVFIPRILIGWVSGFVYENLGKHVKQQSLIVAISAILASLTNTVLVLGGIVIFFGQEYAEVVNIAYDALLGFIMGIILTAGLMEAAVAAVFSVAIIRASRIPMKGV